MTWCMYACIHAFMWFFDNFLVLLKFIRSNGNIYTLKIGVLAPLFHKMHICMHTCMYIINLNIYNEHTYIIMLQSAEIIPKFIRSTKGGTHYVRRTKISQVSNNPTKHNAMHVHWRSQNAALVYCTRQYLHKIGPTIIL